MAWFGESLASLSNLKGQITNFTKDVLSEGIVEEVGTYSTLTLQCDYESLLFHRCTVDQQKDRLHLSDDGSTLPTETFI